MAYWCDDEGLNREQRRLDAQQAEARHHYRPSVLHMGDCSICGNLADHPNHIKAPASAPFRRDLFDGPPEG